MKFIYFYSPLYEYYKTHIENRIDQYFTLESILINDLTKKNTDSWHTFCDGVSVKIELVIQKIKENMGDFIIFSDATIFINKYNVTLLPDFFDSYKHHDICFADNTGYGEHYNIGLMLIKCNDDTLSFFKNVLCDLITQNSWDQHIVNNHLENTKLNIGCFDNTKIMCGDEFNSEYKTTFYIYKSFICHTSDPNVNFNSRIYKFYNAGLIDYNELTKTIKTVAIEKTI